MSEFERAESGDYTVRLAELFQGPMDLLLHLVREQEVDIHEIEIGKVVDGYLSYLRDLREIDIEVASDFVLMAAMLMAIKSRALLPREEVDLEAELDPRDELIQRLIEYRRFKQAAGDLEERRAERARLFPRAARPPDREEPTLDVAELSAWDLLSAWTRLLRETLHGRALHIDPDARPLRHYVEELVRELKARREIKLETFVRELALHEGATRQQLIGTFCALLELIKIGVARARQSGPKQDIAIVLRDDLEGDVDDVVRASGLEDEELPAAGSAAEASAP